MDREKFWIIPEKEVDASYFVSREDLKKYGKRAMDAMNSPDLWKMAGLEYVQLTLDPRENSDTQMFDLKPGYQTNKLKVILKIVPQIGNSAEFKIDFDLGTEKIVSIGYSEVIYGQAEPVKSVFGKIADDRAEPDVRLSFLAQ